MKRLLIVLGAAATSAAAIYGAAASLGSITGNTSLAADAAVISSCDTDGVNVFNGTGAQGTPQRFRVRFVRVSQIHDDCLGRGAYMFFTGAGGANIWPGPGSWYGPVLVVAQVPPVPNDNTAFFDIESGFTGPAVEDVQGLELQIGD